MGTPEFAVPSLRALVAGGYNVVGVVTAPDKPAGRGQKLRQSEVKTAALELGLPVLQPEKLKAPEFVEAMQALRPDLGIVIAFRMLPEVIWAMPRLGTFNLHASLLPQYRGAAPINWAIINGETETGVTTFLLNHEIDKGGIIGQVRVPILPEDNVGTLYDKLMTTGTALVTSTVDRIAAGDIRPVEQQHIDESTLRPAPKIFKEDCRMTGRFRAGASRISSAACRRIRRRGPRCSARRTKSRRVQSVLGDLRGRSPRPAVRHGRERRTDLYPRGVRRRIDRSRRVADSRQETARGARPTAGLARREPIQIQEITRFSVAKPSYLFRQPPHHGCRIKNTLSNETSHAKPRTAGLTQRPDRPL